MTLWGEMHEELKNEKMTPTSELDEYIIHLNNKLRGIIVKKKKIMILEDYVLKLLIEHNYCLLENNRGKTHRFLEKDGGKNYQHILSW